MVRVIFQENKDGVKKIILEDNNNDLSPNLSRMLISYLSGTAVLRIQNGNNLPSEEEIEKYILSQPEYEHSITDVGLHFLGKSIKSTSGLVDERRQFFMLAKKLEQVRRAIVKREGGSWESKRPGFGSSVAFKIKK